MDVVYHMVHPQQWLHLLIPPTSPPGPSTGGVPKVSATHTFPDAQIAPWSSPEPDRQGLVIAPALASPHLPLL